MFAQCAAQGNEVHHAYPTILGEYHIGTCGDFLAIADTTVCLFPGIIRPVVLLINGSTFSITTPTSLGAYVPRVRIRKIHALL